MSQICQLCGENETEESTHNRICDACYDNAGNYLETNMHLIKAIPYLIDACNLAEEEISQWNEVMGGSEDPRTQAAIDALNDALAMNTKKHPQSKPQ
jgi:hypothetical protein